MELKQGQITFLFDHEGAYLEIKDRLANTVFVRVKLNEKQVCEMLSRLSNTECEKIEVFNLDHVGKEHENKSFEFILPKHDYNERKQCALETIKDVCPDGWISDDYFSSQDSFFKIGDKEYARVNIRRWK